MKQNECCSDCADFAFGEDTSCRNKSCHCHSPEPVESWEEEFDGFVADAQKQHPLAWACTNLEIPATKYFIRRLLTSQKQKQIEEVCAIAESMKWNPATETPSVSPNVIFKDRRQLRNDTLDDIIAKLRGTLGDIQPLDKDTER